MSYAGYDQLLCANGHYFNGPDRWHLSEEIRCSCGAAVAWSNSVDETNCDSWGVIPTELLREKFLVSEQVVETCNLGHPHVTSPAVYRIPTDEETEALRHYRPGYGETPLVPLVPKVKVL